MFVFDVETLSKSSEAVILSMAAVYFEPSEKPSHHQMRETGFFVKFNAKDQIERLHRKMGKSTIDWWAKQCDNVKKRSFIRHENDVIFEDGYEMMRTWSKQFPKGTVFARGNLDQLVLDSIEEQCGLEPIWPYHLWRDVRTAIDFIYDTSNGYCDVDYEGFDSFLDITKHDPLDDCILDGMMLLYGKTK